MKGIARSLGAMNITLKLDAKPFKRRTYHINPIYKEKVQNDIDCMIEC
jgi:hypothetical protein